MDIKLLKNKSFYKYKILFIILMLVILNIFCISCDYKSIFTKKSKLPDTINITINYVLPDYIYNSKEELFNEFFLYFYNYIVSVDGGIIHLKMHNINNVEDLYKACKTWEKGSSMGLPLVGNILGKYFLFPRVGGNFVEQKNYDYFVGHCLNNDKFVDFLYFDKNFFYHFRKDEGYTGSKEDGKDPYGSDFFASSFSSIIDTAKFFYYTIETLPPHFIDKKNIPNLYNQIPGVLKNYFANHITISYDTNSNIPYKLQDDFNCYGFEFSGYYLDSNFNSEPISYIDNDFIINQGLISNDNATTLYAKFVRFGQFADEYYSDFTQNVQH